MNKGSRYSIRVPMTIGLLCLGSAQAAPVLVKVDNNQVLDTSTNLVWASDWKLIKTSGFDSDGFLSWNQANAWIAKLNNDNYAGHSDWRLPTASTTSASNCSSHFNAGGVFGDQYYGYGCNGSEIGHLFYDALGGKANESILNPTGDSAQQLANLGLFTNVYAVTLWTATDYAPSTDRAWYFDSGGGQLFQSKFYDQYSALAVRPADAGPQNVPEPSTTSLAALALIGTLLTSRRITRRR